MLDIYLYEPKISLRVWKLLHFMDEKNQWDIYNILIFHTILSQ